MSLYFSYGPSYADSLITTTLSRWSDTEAVDNIFNKTPTLKKLHDKSKKMDGGLSIVVPVMYGVNSTAQAYSGYEQLDTTPQEGLTAGQELWKQYSVSIAISGLEARQNNGKAKIIDMLKTKTTQGVESLRREITSDLFASTAATKKIVPFPVLFDATSTVHDINSTSYSWWQANVNTSGISFASDGLSTMRTMYTGLDKVNPNYTIDSICTTDTIYNYYEGSLIQAQRYKADDNTGNASFEYLKFKSCSVWYDAAAPSGTLFMFPSEALRMYVHTGANFVESEWVRPYNQDARVKQVLVMVSIVTPARRKLGKITDITA